MSHTLQPAAITWSSFNDSFGRRELHVSQHCTCGVGYELRVPVDGYHHKIYRELAEQDLTRRVEQELAVHARGSEPT